MPEGLFDYFKLRQEARAARIQAVWNMMTKREQALFQSAAVMAGIRARWAVGNHEPPPPDSQVVADVIDACLSLPDLYPALIRLDRRAKRKAAKERAHETDLR